MIMKTRSRLFFTAFSFLFLVLMIGIASAGPFQINTGPNGYQIETPSASVLPQYQDYIFNFHVFNLSNGALIDNSSTSCFFHLYNSSGSRIFDTQSSFNAQEDTGNEWQTLVAGGNFSYDGYYAYSFICNSTSENLGGFILNPITVTPSGSQSLSIPVMIVIMIICYGLGIFGFFIWKEKWFSFAGGVLMIFLGVFIVQYGIDIYLNSLTTAIGEFTWAIGLIFMCVPIWEDIRENINWFFT